MHFTLVTSIVALAVLSAAARRPAGQGKGFAIPLSKRSSLTNADKSVDMDALKSHLASTEVKIRRGLENYERNTGKEHPSAVKRGADRKRGIGKGPLTGANGVLNRVAWYGTISVGTPGQTLTVNIDTISTDLIIPSSDCDESCIGHTIWKHTLSKTANDLQKPFSLDYDDYETFLGDLFMDTVQVAGLTATSQTIAAATSYPGLHQYPLLVADGLMGMAFEPLSHFDAPGFFDTLVRESQLTEDVFSLKLASSGSELYLGGSNSELYTGDFAYVNLTNIAWWEVTMDNIQVNGSTILKNIDSIIDTSAEYIMGHPSDVSSFYKATGGTPAPDLGDGIYTYPCDKFPTVSITFAGVSFPISSLNVGKTANPSNCISGIIGVDNGAKFWSLGNVFLQDVYTRFDFAYGSVGFARLRNA